MSEEHISAVVAAENSIQMDGVLDSFLVEYYHQRTGDPMQNIQLIVNSLGRALGSAAALYNRLEEDGLLRTWAIDSPPPGFAYEDTPEGHICYAETILDRGPGRMHPVELTDLGQTPFAECDINVKTYGLKAYLGAPVELDFRVVGSLAVVFGEPRSFSNLEKEIIELHARAISFEEERKATLDTIGVLNKEVRRLNRRLREIAA